jgi:prevent-host-death family protein
MIVVSIQEAQRDLPKLLDRVMSGEEVIIASGDKEVAVVSPKTKSPKPRVPGSAKGRISIPPDFNAPLPDETLERFEA